MALTIKHNKTGYNLNDFQKKYFSFSYILLTNNNESSYNSQQPLACAENNTSQQPEENNTSQQPEDPKTFLDSKKDKLAEEQVRLDRLGSYIAEEANKAGVNRVDVTSQIAGTIDYLRDNRNLSPTTLDRLDKNKDKYDKLDQRINQLIAEEDGDDSAKNAYYTRFSNECIATRHLKDVNNMLGDRNVTMRERENLSELEGRMKNCKQDDIRVSEYDTEYIKKSIELDMKSGELDSMRRYFAEGSSEENMYSSSDEKMSDSSDENRAPSSDENRAPTTEESSKVDKSKSTEEESSSVDKGKATEEGSSKEDNGKRKATEEEAYEGETKRSRVDAPSSDENRGSLIDEYADVSTEMPSYMDPDDG